MSAVLACSWLDALDALLEPLGSSGVALIDGDVDAPECEWQSTLPQDAALRERSLRFGADAPDRGGWVLRLRAAPAEAPRVFVRGVPASLAPERLARAMGLCRLAWHLREGVVIVAPDPLREEIHSLRNALNSVGMNAAVLSSKALPPSLQEFAEDLDRAVQRSLGALGRVSALLTRH